MHIFVGCTVLYFNLYNYLFPYQNVRSSPILCRHIFAGDVAYCQTWHSSFWYGHTTHASFFCFLQCFDTHDSFGFPYPNLTLKKVIGQLVYDAFWCEMHSLHFYRRLCSVFIWQLMGHEMYHFGRPLLLSQFYQKVFFITYIIGEPVVWYCSVCFVGFNEIVRVFITSSSLLETKINRRSKAVDKWQGWF